MKVLELFAGERCIGKAFERAGHEVYSVDWDKIHPNIDWYTDISKVTAQDILERFGHPDVIWMSPDCTTYSVAAISHHRQNVNGELQPKTEYAKFCDALNVHCNELINELHPSLWFRENPRGGMRKMSFVAGLPRYTVTYCQYGDTRQKPTDIWTNHPNPNFLPPCKPGSPCHQAAPRGSRTGTLGRAGHVMRSLIPDKLCDHIVKICEVYMGVK
jgi:hypothetical protein